MYSYHIHVTSELEAPYPLLSLIIYCYRRPFKALKPPRLQFFTNQLRVSPCFVLCRLSSSFVTVHFASSYVSLAFLLCTSNGLLLSSCLSWSCSLFLNSPLIPKEGTLTQTVPLLYTFYLKRYPLHFSSCSA